MKELAHLKITEQHFLSQYRKKKGARVHRINKHGDSVLTIVMVNQK
jgi:hypothetical protein